MKNDTHMRVAVALSGLLAGACATLPAKVEKGTDGVEASLNNVVDELVAGARTRTDLSSMLVYIHELDEDEARPAAGRHTPAGAPSSEVVEHKLSAGLLHALSRELHMLDVELAEDSGVRRTGALVPEVAKHLGATHAIVGSYARKDDELVLSLRLVDSDSLVIVAAARGVVPCRAEDFVVTPAPAPLPKRHVRSEVADSDPPTVPDSSVVDSGSVHEAPAPAEPPQAKDDLEAFRTPPQPARSKRIAKAKPRRDEVRTAGTASSREAIEESILPVAPAARRRAAEQSVELLATAATGVPQVDGPAAQRMRITGGRYAPPPERRPRGEMQ